MSQLMPDPEHQKRLLRMATAAGHRGPSQEQLMDELNTLLTPLAERETKKANGLMAKAMFGIGKKFAKDVGELQTRIDGYLDRNQVLAGEAGLFDSRSLGCWLAIAARAGVPAVPAEVILEIPEVLLQLVIDSEQVDQEPSQPGAMWNLLNGISNGQLERALGRIDRIPVATKRKMHQIALALLYKAGENIPGGAMVRHDHMGPNTLKSWACIGWEPWNGDDGVDFSDTAEDGTQRRVVLGPGWMMRGNDRAVDVLDSRTTMAIAQACVDIHTFWARPWMKPARRYGGFDICRPASWPEEMRRGTWPAEWRVFIRAGRAVACSSYYPWAEISGDSTDVAMATKAMELAQKMADAATQQNAIPDDPHLARAHKVSAEAREMLPAGTVNATLDFLETDQGLLFLEGAMAQAPGGYGAHPCAFAGHRWAEGIKFQLDPGINIAEPKTWPEEALRGFKR